MKSKKHTTTSESNIQRHRASAIPQTKFYVPNYPKSSTFTRMQLVVSIGYATTLKIKYSDTPQKQRANKKLYKLQKLSMTTFN